MLPVSNTLVSSLHAAYPPLHHYMATPLGSGSDPVHTLFDEQGNEIPVEVDSQEIKSLFLKRAFLGVMIFR